MDSVRVKANIRSKHEEGDERERGGRQWQMKYISIEDR